MPVKVMLCSPQGASAALAAVAVPVRRPQARRSRLDQGPIARRAPFRSRDPHMAALRKRNGHVASQAAPDLFHHQIALRVDHDRYALRTTSVPGRAYSATSADKGL